MTQGWRRRDFRLRALAAAPNPTLSLADRCVRACSCVFVRVRACVCMHTCIYVYQCARKHTRTHTHTNTKAIEIMSDWSRSNLNHAVTDEDPDQEHAHLGVIEILCEPSLPLPSSRLSLYMRACMHVSVCVCVCVCVSSCVCVCVCVCVCNIYVYICTRTHAHRWRISWRSWSFAGLIASGLSVSCCLVSVRLTIALPLPSLPPSLPSPFLSPSLLLFLTTEGIYPTGPICPQSYIRALRTRTRTR